MIFVLNQGYCHITTRYLEIMYTRNGFTAVIIFGSIRDNINNFPKMELSRFRIHMLNCYLTLFFHDNDSEFCLPRMLHSMKQWRQFDFQPRPPSSRSNIILHTASIFLCSGKVKLSFTRPPIRDVLALTKFVLIPIATEVFIAVDQ